MRWLRIGRQIDSFTLRFLIVACLTSLGFYCLAST